MNVNVLSRKEKNIYIENQRSMKMDMLIFIRGVKMSEESHEFDRDFMKEVKERKRMRDNDD